MHELAFPGEKTRLRVWLGLSGYKDGLAFKKKAQNGFLQGWLYQVMVRRNSKWVVFGFRLSTYTVY